MNTFLSATLFLLLVIWCSLCLHTSCSFKHQCPPEAKQLQKAGTTIQHIIFYVFRKTSHSLTSLCALMGPGVWVDLLHLQIQYKIKHMVCEHLHTDTHYTSTLGPGFIAQLLHQRHIWHRGYLDEWHVRGSRLSAL